VLALPIVVYGLFFGCNRSAGCLQLFPTLSLPVWPQSAQLYSTEATLVFLGWFFGLLALHLLVDGKRVQGVVLPDGSRLTYKLNGGTTSSWSMQSNLWAVLSSEHHFVPFSLACSLHPLPHHLWQLPLLRVLHKAAQPWLAGRPLPGADHSQCWLQHPTRYLPVHLLIQARLVPVIQSRSTASLWHWPCISGYPAISQD
jgi:hypothetical protein